MRHAKSIFGIAAVVLLSMMGCTKEDTTTGGGTLPTGETVSVTLGLSLDALQTPGAKSKSAATGTSRVIHSERSESMLVELIEEPAQPQTRTMDDSQIANIWVFQYDGTGLTSKLIRKGYYDNYTTQIKFELYARASQRVVVIANTFSATFGDDQTLSTSTYQTLLDKTTSVATQDNLLTNGGNNIPLSGTSTEAVKEGNFINISLIRNVAQVTFKVKTGNITAKQWTIQMCDVPNVSYWMAQRDDTPFPASVTSVSYPVQTIAGINSDNFTEFSWYVPTNIRGTVEGTTAKQRVTNAPKGATYVKVTGIGESIDNNNVTINATNYYSIHLGVNFTTDYNLKPNYHYTYQVTLYTDPGKTDSRVKEVVDLAYVGMFGGELQGGELQGWAFSKPLYVATTDEVENTTTTWQWALANGDHSALAGSTIDGRANTWNLNKVGNGTDFPAANRCFIKNNSLVQASKEALLWYLPAEEQLMGIWITHNGSNASFGDGVYWSSSKFYSDSSWCVKFDSGSTYYFYKTIPLLVRCVREL